MVSRPADRSSLVVLALGGTLFAVAVAHHVTEIEHIDRVSGPMMALALDGLLALAVAYSGYLLAGSDFSPEHRWRITVWCLAGAGVFLGTVTASIGIQHVEGRTVAEPTFQLLIAADAGALAGLLAGYYNVQTREHARQAERTTDALEFVNGLLRHDVYNHVSAIVAHAGLVECESDDEAVVESATIIREQADDLTALVENTGDIVETVSDGGEFGRVDLAAVADDVAEQVDETFEATVTTDLPDRAPVVANDAVRSAVTNLVENAAEHNDADDPCVEVSAVKRDDVVRLRVTDNGPGIDEQDVTEVFEPREGDRHGGGLHLTATLVENYGGDVWVDDGSPGATFALELPRHDER